jgi:VWFA-related protein
MIRPFTLSTSLTAVFVLCMSLLPSAWQDRPAAPQAPSAPQLTFRVETNFIEIDAIVTDGRGTFVRDLKREDFSVFEDGKPQKLDAFSLVDIPLERVDRPLYREDAVDPDVFTNERDFEGRIYLIVLDSYHVAPIRTTQAKRVARDFVLNYMAANDSAAVVHVGRTDVSQEFTSNKRLLLNAIDKFMGQKLRSKVLNKFDNVQVAVSSDQPPQDHDWPERIGMARATVESLGKLSSYMTGIQGRRKAVLFVSEGLDFDVDDVIGAPRLAQATDPYGLASNSSQEASDVQAVAREMQVTLEAATRGNVAVYAVDPRGLTDASEELIAVPGRVEIADSPAADVPVKALGEEIRRSQGMLRTLSNQTGASAITSTNNFADGFGRIVQDNSTYYMLGYHGQPKNDGKFHDLTVKVTRPGLQVRARKGYYALKTDLSKKPAPAADPLREMLLSPMALRGLTMRATADSVKGPAPQAIVQIAVEIDGAGLGFTEKNGTFVNKVEWSYAVLDAAGVVKTNGRKTADFALTPKNKEAVAEHGLRFATEIELPPGRYQFRVAGKEGVGGRTGSVFWDVTVPDFAAPALSMSDIILTSSRAGAAPTITDTKTLKGLLPGPPTAHRIFSLEDTVAVFAEIYDNKADTPHTVDLNVTVRTDDGTQVFKAEEERDSKEIGAARGGFGYLVRIPMQDLVPGRFVLTVEARSRLGGDPIKRETEFRVK